MFENRGVLDRSPAHELALDCVEVGVTAARPERVVREAVAVDEKGKLTVRADDPGVSLPGYEEVVLVGAGKAAAHVAATLERLLGDWLSRGVVVTNDPVETDRVDVVEASHPVPDEAGVEGTQRIRELLDEADNGSYVVAVFTGGGSALLPAPAGDIGLQDLQTVTEGLLESGASIAAINAVRKHCSEIKGGQLARIADPAPVCTVLFSDVVGDDPAVIASGPTVPDPTTFEDAQTALEAESIDAPDAVSAHLERGADGDLPETPTAGDVVFDDVSTHVLANGWTAIEAAREAADDAGYEPLVLSSRIEGEAREAARTHAAIATEIVETGNPIEPPVVVVSGGETTVTVSGDGRGGPNCEFALSAARSLPKGAVLVSVDTDGEDGTSGAAGGIVDAATVDDSDAATTALADNDTTSYLDARDCLVRTDKTGTNVNDLRVLVVPTGCDQEGPDQG